MNASRWRLWPKRSRDAQRGSLIVTTFVIVVGLTLILGSVNYLLKQQMEASLEIKKLSLGRLQAYYLAEMGVNEFMYNANIEGILPSVADPMHLKNFVAMTKDLPTGLADVQLTDLGGNRYRVETTLVTEDGTFHLPYDVTFSIARDAKQLWVLTDYEVSKP